MKDKADLTNPLLIDLLVPIRTPRLILKPPLVGDGPIIAEAVRESWDSLHRYEDWAVDINVQGTDEYWEISTRESMSDFILRRHLNFRAYCAKSSKFIGLTDLCHPDWRIRSFVAGYWIRESEQNKGYATEACNALTRYAFGALSARLVGIGHAVGNIASEKVISKCGFQRIGSRPKILVLADGTITDDVIYARENTDGIPELDVTWG